MSKLARDGTAKPVSRDQILRRKRGQGNSYFLCSADLEQDWQPYLVDSYSCYLYVMATQNDVRMPYCMLKLTLHAVVRTRWFYCDDTRYRLEIHS